MSKQQLVENYLICNLEKKYPLISSFEEFQAKIKSLLEVHEIKFKYQKRGCKRAGAAIYKINNQEKSYTIALDPDLGAKAQINIFIHELMHILLDHLVPKPQNKYYLTGPQKEFVVDFLAEYHTLQLTQTKPCDYADEFNRHNIQTYRNDWIRNARMNKKQLEIIEMQIEYGKELLVNYFEEEHV